jgi:hypothetical protein
MCRALWGRSNKYITAVFIFLMIIAGVASADENDNNVNPLAYIEPGPIQEAIDRVDGTVIEMQTEILWRPFIDMQPADLSADQFEEYIRQRRQIRPLENTKIEDQAKTTRGLNIIFNLDASVPPNAVTAMGEVESYLEGIFHDPITVRINIDFDGSLPSGVLGATGVYTSSAVTWTTARSKFVTDMDFDDFIQDHLPLNSIPVRYNGSSSTITAENRCYFAWANYGAIGYTISGNSGETSINPDFSWDYDPSNGVSGYCFKSVMIHEIGHVLGFMSRAEQWYDPASDIFALDIYRFQRTDGTGDYNPDSYSEFTTAPRLVDYNNPNDAHNSNIFYAVGTDVEYRMSDGNPYQASHFREGSVNAIMDPAFSYGETCYPNYMKTADLDMFDAIGWDYPNAPPDSTPPTPDPLTWDSEPAGVSSSSISMTATEADDDTPPVEYYFEAIIGNSSGWQTARTYTDNGLDPNSEYSYRAKARDNADPANEGEFSSIQSAYTFANIPGAPLLSDPAYYTMDLDVNPNGNPSITEFAIQCSSTSDGYWNGRYINAAGYPSASAVWQTDFDWGTITIHDLDHSTQYCFHVKARNADLYETSFGMESCLSTVTNNPPGVPYDPYPPDDAIDIDAGVALTWACSDPDPLDTVRYDVYLEADDLTPDILVSENQLPTVYDPDILYETDYFWQIVAEDKNGGITYGPVWHFATMVQPYICGDANGDGDVNVSDAVHIINYIFAGGLPPDPTDAGDTNCDGEVNVSDAVWIINYIFEGGNEPCDVNGDTMPDC